MRYQTVDLKELYPEPLKDAPETPLIGYSAVPSWPSGSVPRLSFIRAAVMSSYPTARPKS